MTWLNILIYSLLGVVIVLMVITVVLTAINYKKLKEKYKYLEKTIQANQEVEITIYKELDKRLKNLEPKIDDIIGPTLINRAPSDRDENPYTMKTKEEKLKKT